MESRKKPNLIWWKKLQMKDFTLNLSLRLACIGAEGPPDAADGSEKQTMNVLYVVIGSHFVTNECWTIWCTSVWEDSHDPREKELPNCLLTLLPFFILPSSEEDMHRKHLLTTCRSLVRQYKHFNFCLGERHQLPLHKRWFKALLTVMANSCCCCWGFFVHCRFPLL